MGHKKDNQTAKGGKRNPAGELTAEWHEGVANNMTEGELQKFPQPWIDGAEIDAHKIVPITDSRELYLASKAAQLCQRLRDDILGSYRCLYTVINGDGRPAVMVELVRTHNGVVLGQIKGYCNGSPPKGIERMVRRWFNRNKSAVRLPDARRSVRRMDLRPLTDNVLPLPCNQRTTNENPTMKFEKGNKAAKGGKRNPPGGGPSREHGHWTEEHEARDLCVSQPKKTEVK
jgi:hypothetical protein